MGFSVCMVDPMHLVVEHVDLLVGQIVEIVLVERG